MTYFTDVWCQECHQTKQMAVGGGIYPTICHECEVMIAEKKLQTHLEEMRKLSIEERIERIEKWIFTYRPSTSLRDLIGHE